MAIARAVDRRLFLLLERAHTRVFRDANNHLKSSIGLTVSQGGALFFLNRHDGCRIGDLALGIGLGAPAATGLVDRMAKSGLVRRGAEKDDARASRVYLTEKGRGVSGAVADELKIFNDAIAHGFTDAEMETVYRFLTGLARRDYEGKL